MGTFSKSKNKLRYSGEELNKNYKKRIKFIKKISRWVADVARHLYYKFLHKSLAKKSLIFFKLKLLQNEFFGSSVILLKFSQFRKNFFAPFFVN